MSRVPLPQEAWLWRLKAVGSCGVGDHSRGLRENLGMRIVDHATGHRPSGAPLLLQWVPSGWTESLGWYGPMLAALEAAHPQRTVLMLHELWRQPRLFHPRSYLPALHDQLALRRVLPWVQQVIATTQVRKRMLLRAQQAWGTRVPVDVVHVPSNVHLHDPPSAVEEAPPDPCLVVFAQSGVGVLCGALARTLRLVLQAQPRLRVMVLGTILPRRDQLTQALEHEGVASRIERPGSLEPQAVAERLSLATLALSLHDTGISGRRGTVAAILAAGVPVVAATGVETDSVWRNNDSVTLPTSAHEADAHALAQAVLEQLNVDGRKQRNARQAARDFYLRHHSWARLKHVLGSPSTPP